MRNKDFKNMRNVLLRSPKKEICGKVIRNLKSVNILKEETIYISSPLYHAFPRWRMQKKYKQNKLKRTQGGGL